MPVSKTDLLGKTIVDYVPYRRGQLLLKLLPAGFGAAVLWFIMKQIEPHILVPILGIGALILSFYSLTILFRLLGPGKRVTLYEKGLVLGRKTYRWDQVEKVRCQLELPTRHETIEYERHKFWFHLADGKTELLSFTDDYLPSHVNVDELIGCLRQYVSEVDLVDDPKMRKEKTLTEAVQRDSDLARALWAMADAAIEEASKEGISPKVVTALRKGQKLRAELARKYRRSSFGFGIASGLITLATVIVTLAGLYTSFALLFQIATDLGWGDFDLFDVLDFPRGALRYGAMGAIIAAAWWSAGRMEDLARRKRKQSRQQSAVAGILKSENANSQTDAFLSRASSGEPFGVYLRSFSGEYLQYLEKPIVAGSEYQLPVEYEIVERDFDIALAESASDRMPIFALANVRDASVSRRLHILSVRDADWFLVACELIYEADAILVHLAAASESLLVELGLLDRLSFRDKTFLIFGKNFDENILSEAEKALVSRFSNRSAESSTNWRNDLMKFLSQSGVAH